MAFAAPVLGLKLKFYNPIQTRGTRHEPELKRYNTTQCCNFFTYKIARLPAGIVNSDTVGEFKNKLDKIIKTC